MFGARIISILGPILAFGALAWLFKSPEYFYYLLFLASVIISFSLWSLFKASKSEKTIKERFIYLVFSLLLILSSQGLFIMLEIPLIKWGIWLLGFALTLWYFNNLFKRLFNHNLFIFKEEALLFNLYEAVIIFFTASTLFGLKDFINYNLGYLFLVLALIVFFLVWGNLRVSELKKGEEWIYALLTCLITVELFWAMAALSLAFYLKGIIFAFVYLIFLSYRLMIVDASFNRKYFKHYVVFSLILILAILLTAKWF